VQLAAGQRVKQIRGLEHAAVTEVKHQIDGLLPEPTVVREVAHGNGEPARSSVEGEVGDIADA